MCLWVVYFIVLSSEHDIWRPVLIQFDTKNICGQRPKFRFHVLNMRTFKVIGVMNPQHLLYIQNVKGLLLFETIMQKSRPEIRLDVWDK